MATNPVWVISIRCAPSSPSATPVYLLLIPQNFGMHVSAIQVLPLSLAS
uniref:Uncharacterized protein n=1 Tax=Arundo donax TaxID=35708 RepID=A0A0A9BMB2_ARUDO